MKAINLMQAEFRYYPSPLRMFEFKVLIGELSITTLSWSFMGTLLGMEKVNKKLYLHLMFLCLTISLPFKSGQ